MSTYMIRMFYAVTLLNIQLALRCEKINNFQAYFYLDF